jgi:hypothetical protein
MVGMVIAFPTLVTGGIEQGVKIDAEQALETMGVPEAATDPAAAASEPEAGASEPEAGASEPESGKEDDPMKALQDAIKQDGAKK